MTPLAVKYRPNSFADMIGQKINSLVLSKMVETDNVPPGLLFSGVRGSGKTSAARILAASLGAGDVIEIDAASRGSVQDVRDLIEILRVSSGGARRVIIYDEAQSMSREALNALLKTLEEPPYGVTFLLITTEPEKIPETVKSRLMEFVFRKVSASDISLRIAQVASKESIPLSKELAVYLGDRADGSVRDGLMLLDQCFRAGISSKEEFMDLAGESYDSPLLVRAMLTGDHKHIFEVLADVSSRMSDPDKIAASIVDTLRDVLVLRAGGKLNLPQEPLEVLSELSRNLEPDRVLAALKMIWDLRTKARQAGDPKSNLDLVVVLVTEVFTRGRTTSLKPAVSSSTRKMTLEEL